MPTTVGKATEFITFSRGSLATVTDSNGLIKWAPHNLLTHSEQFDNSAWLASGTVIAAPTKVAANAVAAPNGTTTADEVSFPAVTGAGDVSILVQSFTNMPLVQHTAGIWVKAKAAGDIGKQIVLYSWTGVMAIKTHVTLDGTWQYVSASGTWTANNPNYAVGVIGSTYGGVNQGAVSVYLWGAHLYRSDLGGMQANASAYPYYNPSTPRNLLGYSEAFDNAYWTKSGLAATPVVANAIAAPNGSLSADKIVENTSNVFHEISRAATTVLNTPYTFSVYAKAGERSFLYLSIYDTGNRASGFNLATGQVVGAATGGATRSITSVGDGWYRCSVTVAVAATTCYPFARISLDGTDAAYTGDGTSGIYLWGAQLSDSASLDPYVPNFGAAPSAAAAHGPRLDYDPVTLAAKGLLVEEARTNLLQRSAEFDNIAWVKGSSGVSLAPAVTANTAIAPDGTQTADTVVFDLNGGTTSSDLSQLSQNPSVSSAIYTFSFWAKTSDGTSKVFSMVGSAGSAVPITITGSWQRFVLPGSVSGAGDARLRLRGNEATATSASIHIWGAQYELGAFATSYIPTLASTVTRNADVASVATSQFPYSASASSLVVSASLLAVNVGGQFVAALSDNTLNNRIALFNGSGSANINQIVTTSGATQSTINTGSVAAGSVFRVGTAVTTNDAAAYLNGAAGTPDTTVTMPPASVLYIGADEIGTARLNGHIRQITYIPRRLTDAELIARTA